MDIKKNSNPSQPLVKKAEAIRLRDTKLSVKYIDIKLINQQTQQDINNLYKSVDGKLVFVTCAKLGVDGKVILPDVTEKGRLCSNALRRYARNPDSGYCRQGYR